MNTPMVKRALLSVSDKQGLLDLAQQLNELDVEIISTGGTSKLLAEAKIKHVPIESVTALPEMLGGRVKTLHPKIHGGILAKRDEHEKEMQKHAIDGIDLVVVNFYPFAQALKNEDLDWRQMVEYIDIGGPTMVRAAAKNYEWVGVLVDPEDYTDVINEIRADKGLKFETRRRLAQKAFEKTSQYDAMIHQYFNQAIEMPEAIQLSLKKSGALRYGENPHQKASAYQFASAHNKGVLAAKQWQGKALSYNNILDAEAALNCVQEFEKPACVIVKHANPCGVAIADHIAIAYQHAYQADSTAAFGGIIALNQACDEDLAKIITQVFMEIVIAPAFSEQALTEFAKKPNLRVLQYQNELPDRWEMKFITGGVLLQERDQQKLCKEDLVCVTKLKPTASEIETALFAWQAIKHVKSNAILIAQDATTVSIGAGQVSRIDAVKIALTKAGDKTKNAVLASDAFFPFRDSIDQIAVSGIRVIVQPGGSVRDEEVITACNEHNIVMLFTGKRCFKH